LRFQFLQRLPKLSFAKEQKQTQMVLAQPKKLQVEVRCLRIRLTDYQGPPAQKLPGLELQTLKLEPTELRC
jgi:hypothetical protein